MPRLICIDYGKKRTGLAVSDPEQIIATGLETVDSNELIGYLKKYFATEAVERAYIGYPLNMDGSATDATPLVEKFIGHFMRIFPHIPLEKIDERLSSRLASAAISEMGLKKKVREQKSLIDVTAATMMLQEVMAYRP
jgi:putative Holliday junction resolvase